MLRGGWEWGEGEDSGDPSIDYLKGGWYLIVIINFKWEPPKTLFLSASAGVFFTISDLAADVRVAAQPLVAFSNLPARTT